MKKIISCILTLCMLASLTLILALPMSAEDEELTPDKSWYSSAATEYVIDTPAELLGLSYLVNDGSETFEGKTIKLGANIALNTGNASEWSESVLPVNLWTPFGSTAAPFKGTFDGQGYSISGLYVCSVDNEVGMFGAAQNATFKNFSLVNSYIKSTGQRTGAIVGRVMGVSSDGGYGCNFSDIYVDAIVHGSKFTGGYVGCILGYATENKFERCVFAGSVSGTDASTGGFIGNDQGAFCKKDGADFKAIGGVVMEDCINIGAIKGGTEMSGGLTGSSQYTSFVRCVNAGTVTGNTKCGGITGRGEYTEIKDSYSCTDLVSVTTDGGILDYFCAHKSSSGSYMGEICTTNVLQSADIKGAGAAQKLTALDFTNVWATVDGAMPLPKTVVTIIEQTKQDYVLPPQLSEGNNTEDDVDTDDDSDTDDYADTDYDDDTDAADTGKENDTTADTAPSTETEAPAEESGCGQFITTGGAVVAFVTIVGTAIITKKREN